MMYTRTPQSMSDLLWPRCVANADIMFLPCGFFLLLFPRLISAVTDWMSTILHTWCGLSANLECRSEMYCMRLPENTGRKKSPSRHHRTTLSGCIVAKGTYRQSEKNMLHSNASSTCTRKPNMVNFGPLPVEIGSGVWCTPANFNGFHVHVLTALL